MAELLRASGILDTVLRTPSKASSEDRTEFTTVLLYRQGHRGTDIFITQEYIVFFFFLLYFSQFFTREEGERMRQTQEGKEEEREGWKRVEWGFECCPALLRATPTRRRAGMPNRDARQCPLPSAPLGRLCFGGCRELGKPDTQTAQGLKGIGNYTQGMYLMPTP